MNNIRNFCIIAHVDHGKSTLADRMLEITGTVEKRNMKAQILDQMDLERERGITIKLTPVRMNYRNHILNLIDTPGHVDFSYEVSRSLAAVEGAILLVDASQGIQAQTLSTLYAALEHNLEIIPVLNKIDLPAARPEEMASEIVKLLGCKKEEILFASGKTGEGVEKILSAIIEKIPPPKGNINDNLSALIFDSVYDNYRGVVSYIRVINGSIKTGEEFSLMQTKSRGKVEEVGTFNPELSAKTNLTAGEIGYFVTGFKDVREAAVGDTVTLTRTSASEPLPGYRQVKPFVYAAIFCTNGDEYLDLKVALEKLKLNDSSFTFEPENSNMLGHGFRCGFLGLLHMDIVVERLEREFNLDLVVTSPTVLYKIIGFDGNEKLLEKVSDLPEAHNYREILEPWASIEIVSPTEYVGEIMDLCQKKRAEYKNTNYLEENRVILFYQMPLSELIIDFYDQLKSSTKGFASLNYEMLDYRPAKLTRIDIMINQEKIDALSFIVHQDKGQREARRLVERLKELIPRQNFEIKIQAAIGSTVIASERVSPFRKDVTAKLYGGDVTRKNKLLDKQKKGKKKMKQIGKVNVPSDVFIKVLRNN